MKRSAPMKRTGIRSKAAKPRTTKTVRCKRQRCSRAVVVGGLCKTHVIEKLDSIVRHRSYEAGECARCGRTNDLQWSHHLSRRFMHIRWDERNYTVHCRACHVYLTHNPAAHTEWIINAIGLPTYARLMEAAYGSPNGRGTRSGTPQFKTADLIEWWERLS